MNLLAAWRAWWFREASLVDLAVSRIVLALLVLRLDAGGRFERVAMVPASQWSPIPFVDALGLGQPDAATVAWAALATKAALVASAFGLVTNVSLAAAFVLQLLQEAWLNSLGKVTHATLPLLWALAFFALSPCGQRLSVDAWIRGQRGAKKPPAVSREAGWALDLLFVEIALFYFQAGTAKLSDAGLRWADGSTLQFYLLAKGGPAAAWLAAHLGLCRAASIAVLAFELGFPLAILVRRFRPWAFAAGLAFHFATSLFLGIGFWPLWSLYALFVPWEALASRWRRPGPSRASSPPFLQTPPAARGREGVRPCSQARS